MNQEELNSAFLKSVINGNIQEATEFLEKGADLNSVNGSGNNAIYISAMRKKKDMFDWLLTINKNGEKINLDHKNINGSSILYSLIKEYDMVEYIEPLLKNGANPNDVSNDGLSPLIRAVADGNIDVIKLLLNTPNIDVNYSVPETKTTAFLMATIAASGPDVLDICKLLIDKGANINAKNGDGKNALINAIFRGQEFMKKNEKKAQKELCKFLIEQNIDLDYVADGGMTAFWIASIKGDRELANLMLERNVNTNVWHEIGTGETGKTSALHSWARLISEKEEDLEFIKKIIALGGKINAPDGLGNTPAVAGFLNPRARKTTLDLGGDVNAIYYFKDPQKKVIKTPVISIVSMAGDSNVEIIKEMIAKGAKVTFKGDEDLFDKEPALVAMQAVAPNIFKEIFNTGKIDPNFLFKKTKNSEELSLLSYSISETVNQQLQQVLNKKKQLEKLKEAKAINDKNGVVSEIIDEEGFKAIDEDLEQLKNIELDISAKKKEIFDFLIENNADVNYKNEKGYTSLFFATTPETANWLLDAGADLFVEANNGDDLLIAAIKQNAVSMLPFIFNKFKENSHPSTTNYYYQLAFSEANNEFEREKIKSGITSLLKPEEIEGLKPVALDPQQPYVVTEPSPLNVDNINYRDEDGNTPLLVACANDNAFLMNLYRKLGADLNAANNNQETPLMHAIAVGNARMVEFLIKNGANVEAKTLEDKSVLDFAEELGDNQILEHVRIALGHGIQEGQLTGFKTLKYNKMKR